MLQREVIMRNPSNPYALVVGVLHVRDHAADPEAALRIATETLQRADAVPLHPYVRRHILFSLIQLVYQIGWSALLLTHPGPDAARTHTHAAACLRAVVGWAGRFCADAPPDAIDLPRALELQLTCELVLRGSKLSDGLSELEVRQRRRFLDLRIGPTRLHRLVSPHGRPSPAQSRRSSV